MHVLTVLSGDFNLFITLVEFVEMESAWQPEWCLLHYPTDWLGLNVDWYVFYLRNSRWTASSFMAVTVFIEEGGLHRKIYQDNWKLQQWSQDYAQFLKKDLWLSTAVYISSGSVLAKGQLE